MGGETNYIMNNVKIYSALGAVIIIRKHSMLGAVILSKRSDGKIKKTNKYIYRNLITVVLHSALSAVNKFN